MAKLLQRISLEACNLGLEHIIENQLNLQEVFPAHGPPVTSQIPGVISSSHSFDSSYTP